MAKLKKTKTEVRRLWRGKPSRWDFWSEGVTSSLLSSFLECREQTRLYYVEGWKPKGTKLALAFGTCCHWVLENIYRGSKSAPSPVLPKAVIRMYDQRWKDEVGKPSQQQIEVHNMAVGLANVVLPHYLRRWAGDFPGGKYLGKPGVPVPAKWLGLEKQFSVPYTYPDGKKTRIRGTRDGVFQDKNGDVWVFDTKCRSVIIEEDIEDTLPLDLQQMLYLWAYEQETEKVAAGTVMNIIRRPGHRLGRDESLGVFFKRVGKEVEKKPDHYFLRFKMEVTGSDMIHWRREVLDPLMQDVRNWVEGGGAHYLNPNSLITKYGRCNLFNAIVHNDFTDCRRVEPGRVLDYQSEVH